MTESGQSSGGTTSHRPLGRRSHFSRLFHRNHASPVETPVRSTARWGTEYRTALSMVDEGVVGWSAEIGLSGGFMLNGEPFRPCVELVALHDLRARELLSVDVGSRLVRLEVAGRDVLASRTPPDIVARADP